MNLEYTATLTVLLSILITEFVTSSGCGSKCFLCNQSGVCINCNSGWYGPGCRKSCQPSCPGGCHKNTGYCLKCTATTYGHLCSQSCSSNCKNVSEGRMCSRKDGYCTNGCQDGFYGGTCEFKCGHCPGGRCARRTGHCVNGCLGGWREPECTDTCAPGCLKCNSSSCLHCNDTYIGTYCNETATMNTTNTFGLTSTERSDVTDVTIVDESSQATVGIALGIVFTVIIVLLVIVFLLVYTKFYKVCLSIFNPGKQNNMPQKEPMFIEDDVGSPKISRSYLKLHEVGVK